MANNLDAAFANKVLDHINGVATLTIATPLKLALSTTVPDDSTAIVEPVGGSYARKTLAIAAAGAKSATNSAAITFDAMPAATIVGFGVYDANGQLIWRGPTTASRDVAAGGSYQVNAGALVLGLG